MDDILALAKGGLAKKTATHQGAIHSAVAGRTDHLPMSLQAGSYVIPADIVSAIGEGNTMAGFKALDTMFATPKASGGSAEIVPIVAAGGEYVITPEKIQEIGGGDIDLGHKALDSFILKMRAKTIKTLKGLAGPKND